MKCIDQNGETKSIQGKLGDNVMYLAHRHNVEIEGTSQGSVQTFHVSCIQHEMHAFGSYLAFTHITTFSLQDPINKSL